jgi:hypothetical protein
LHNAHARHVDAEGRGDDLGEGGGVALALALRAGAGLDRAVRGDLDDRGLVAPSARAMEMACIATAERAAKPASSPAACAASSSRSKSPLS